MSFEFLVCIKGSSKKRDDQTHHPQVSSSCCGTVCTTIEGSLRRVVAVRAQRRSSRSSMGPYGQLRLQLRPYPPRRTSCTTAPSEGAALVDDANQHHILAASTSLAHARPCSSTQCRDVLLEALPHGIPESRMGVGQRWASGPRPSLNARLLLLLLRRTPTLRAHPTNDSEQPCVTTLLVFLVVVGIRLEHRATGRDDMLLISERCRARCGALLDEAIQFLVPLPPLEVGTTEFATKAGARATGDGAISREPGRRTILLVEPRALRHSSLCIA